VQTKAPNDIRDPFSPASVCTLPSQHQTLACPLRQPRSTSRHHGPRQKVWIYHLADPRLREDLLRNGQYRRLPCHSRSTQTMREYPAVSGGTAFILEISPRTGAIPFTCTTMLRGGCFSFLLSLCLVLTLACHYRRLSMSDLSDWQDVPCLNSDQMKIDVHYVSSLAELNRRNRRLRLALDSMKVNFTLNSRFEC
jgi:hypothetical protein